MRLSHAIEAFALASDRDYPLVVVALFQRRSYFHREVDTYARISARAALTVVGIVGEPTSDLPPGPVYLALDEDSPLAREWTVVALSPRSGAALTALDLESLDPYARSLEAGRQFSAHWSFHRADAYAELVRLRAALAPSLSPAAARTVDHVLTQVVALAGDDRDDRSDAALGTLVTELSRAQHRMRDLAGQIDTLVDRRAPDYDPRSGLHTPRFLHRWTGGSATGTLTVGLALIRLPQMNDVRDQHGFRAELALLQTLAGRLTRACSPPDRAVRLDTQEFLLIMPTRSRDDMTAVAEHIHRVLAELSGTYPYVPLSSSIALTATRARPLPLPELRAAARDAETRSRRTVAL